MTDLTEHNKGFAAILQEMYSLEKPAGQLFCGTHITLGFSTSMNKTVRIIESHMKIENFIAGLMVGMEVDTKNSSIGGKALDMCLKLVAPEYSHKAWNYYETFKLYIEEQDYPMLLLAYKDHRFGCLSRASAVLLFYYDILVQFLDDNPRISNRLACLTRELLTF